MSTDLFGTPDFDDFWSLYPRRTAKGAARKAWDKALRTARVAEIMDGAQRFAADPNLPEPQFIPHASTWLNQERWEDGPMPPRGNPSITQRNVSALGAWLAGAS